MGLFELLAPAEAAKTLVLAGGAAVLFSSILGFLMLLPLQPWGRRLSTWIPHKLLGPAHLDWIMLGLMLGLAAAAVLLTDISPPRLWAGAMIAGAWLNPLPYVFRIFGINAFVLAGPPHQVAAASLGLRPVCCLSSGGGGSFGPRPLWLQKFLAEVIAHHFGQRNSPPNVVAHPLG